jgi:hypothetical protein
MIEDIEKDNCITRCKLDAVIEDLITPIEKLI